MKGDLPGLMQDIASFVGLEMEERLLKLVVRPSSLDFMLAPKTKFDDLLMRECFEKIGFLPPGGDSAKVKNGRVEDHRAELPATSVPRWMPSGEMRSRPGKACLPIKPYLRLWLKTLSTLAAKGKMI
jgi:hypothetical protein